MKQSRSSVRSSISRKSDVAQSYINETEVGAHAALKVHTDSFVPTGPGKNNPTTVSALQSNLTKPEDPYSTVGVEPQRLQQTSTK